MTYEEMLQKKEAHKNDIDYCPKCGRIEEGQFCKTCLFCNVQMLPYTSNIPHCPTCNSVAVKKISFAKGYLHWRMFGFFSKTAMSQWECRNCGTKF